jgi:hypothetical protein
LPAGHAGSCPAVSMNDTFLVRVKNVGMLWVMLLNEYEIPIKINGM